MSDDPRVTVPRDAYESLRNAMETYDQGPIGQYRADALAAARALVAAVERPANPDPICTRCGHGHMPEDSCRTPPVPVSEPLCRCGHTEDLHHRWQDDPVNCFGLIGGSGDLPCGCRQFAAPVPVSDEAEAPETFEDELDAHIAESMKDPEYAAADALHREAEASWRNWVPSMFADDENMHTAYVAGYKDSVAGFRAARQAGKDEQP